MADTLDMTLDDIIKGNKKAPSSSSAGRRRGGRRGSAAGGGVGPARRVFKRSGSRAAPYQAAKAPETEWKHDMYAEFPPAPGAAGRVSAIETGTKLFISNLDYGVSNEDIKELFSELGDLKRSLIHYDRSGRSKGTAEVVYARRADALAAVKKYNHVQLDGKPMKIDLVGTNTPTAAAAAFPATAGGQPRQPRNAPKTTQARVSREGLQRRRRRPKVSRVAGGRGKSEGRGKSKSAEELDADLEKYHAEAMQIN